MTFSFAAKFAGALLIAALLFLASNLLGNLLAPEDKPVAAAVEKPSPAAAITVHPPPSMPATDVKRGVKLFKKCRFCHTITKTGRNIVGPNLWNVVGRRQASAGKYRYSAAFKGLDGVWSFEKLNAFLASPKDYVQGTMMRIEGLKKTSERVAVITYLSTFSDSPKPLP